MSINARKSVLTIAAVLALNILFAAWSQYAAADLYKKGSSGATVTEIQTRLKAWGYYTGSVDGTYGSQTEKAVRYFQQSNGLSVDGQAGPETIAALGLPAGSGSGGGSGKNSSSSAGRMIDTS